MPANTGISAGYRPLPKGSVRFQFHCTRTVPRREGEKAQQRWRADGP